eukprot:TRINITY_DN10879_c0_g1_i2.p1 TRINITY_DN10879_c0_g1~~TRINITY_DN10879_c0_g1_i2.p1  ORF type:complete len:596 (+),score=107.94 TRINITY_DN10879_c0_g1_i2:207-1994(+)
MTMAKTEANKKPVLAAEDVNIVTIYGRIFCLQLDRIGMLLHMYRFYRDAVVQQGSLPIYSNKIAVSVVDNVLLVHQVDAKVVILYDIFADSRAPISAPLPLLLRGLPKTIASSSRTSSEQTVNVETDETSGYEGSIYGDSWTFLNPDLVCDTAHGTLWRIHLDLEAIAASSSQVPSVLEFLQRRRMEASKAKNLCLAIVRTVILERRPVPMISKAIDVLVSSYSYSIRVGNSLQGGARGTHSVNPVSGGGEMTPASSIQNMGSSQAMINEPNSKVQIHGKSVIEESMGGVENEPRQILSRDVENEPLDCNEVSTMNRLSACSVSDFEENVNMESVKNNAREPLENSLSSDLHGLGAKGESKCRTRAETSDADVERSLSPSEILEHGGRPMNSNVSSRQESQVACVAISPDEMYNFVFAPVEEEMAGDPIFLVAVIIEYFRSTALEKLKVHPNLYVMTIQLLARNERYAELGLFIINKILEPSKEVALQLLESGRQNVQTRKLGMDMLRQLSLHHDYVLMLVQDGYYLDALRYARKYKVSTIRASLFLEAALASNNSQHLAAVLRFFSDFIPGFKNTSDHSTYCHILNEMSCSVSA